MIGLLLQRLRLLAEYQIICTCSSSILMVYSLIGHYSYFYDAYTLDFRRIWLSAFFVYIYEGIMQYYIYHLEVHTIFDYDYVFYKGAIRLSEI